MSGAMEARWKRHNAEEVVEKLAVANRLVAQGAPISQAAKQIGVTDVTYLRWRKTYGGLSASQLQHIRELEAENARLRKAIRDIEMAGL